MTKFIEFIDIRRLPAHNSVSYHDDTIDQPVDEPLPRTTYSTTSINDMRKIINKLDLSLSTKIITSGSTPLAGRKTNQVTFGRNNTKSILHTASSSSSTSCDSLSDTVTSSSSSDCSTGHLADYESKIDECLDNNDELGLSTRILRLSNDSSPLESPCVADHVMLKPPNTAANELLGAQSPAIEYIDFNEDTQTAVTPVTDNDHRSILNNYQAKS